VESEINRLHKAVDWKVAAEDGCVDWLHVNVGSSAAVSDELGHQRTIIVTVPQVCNLNIVGDADIVIHDKVEASSVVIQTSAGKIVAGKVRGERVVLHSESGDVAVTSGAEGGGSFYGRRVFVKRLLAPKAEIVADEWAVVQSAYTSQLAVRVGADDDASHLSTASSPAAYEHHGCILIPTLHGSADLLVGAGASASARAAGKPAVAVTGITGRLTASVHRGAATGDQVPSAAPQEQPSSAASVSSSSSTGRDADGSAPFIWAQFDELPSGSESSLSVLSVDGKESTRQQQQQQQLSRGAPEAAAVRVFLSPPCAASVSAAGDTTSLALAFRGPVSGLFGTTCDETGPSSATSSPVVLLPGRKPESREHGEAQYGAVVRAWPAPNETTPGVNRGLWPNRDELLQELEVAAKAQAVASGETEDKSSRGKISMDARPTEAFFDHSSSGTDGSLAKIHLVGRGLAMEVLEQEWRDGVGAKAGFRHAAGRALKSLLEQRV
jgi:hypothetical protein